MDSILRTVSIYLFLLLVLRISGKRSLHQITTFDFVLLLIIGEATQQALVGKDYSVTNACIVIATLVGLEIAFSCIQCRFQGLGSVLDSQPLVILAQGKPLEERMRRERINAEDILAAARRQRGLSRLDQIALAVLERDGNITIVPAQPEA